MATKNDPVAVKATTVNKDALNIIERDVSFVTEKSNKMKNEVVKKDSTLAEESATAKNPIEEMTVTVPMEAGASKGMATQRMVAINAWIENMLNPVPGKRSVDLTDTNYKF